MTHFKAKIEANSELLTKSSTRKPVILTREKLSMT